MEAYYLMKRKLIAVSCVVNLFFDVDYESEIPLYLRHRLDAVLSYFHEANDFLDIAEVDNTFVDWATNYTKDHLKLSFKGKGFCKSYYIKFKPLNVFNPCGPNRINDPTETEFKLLSKASTRGIAPRCFVIKDALVIENIENAVCLRNIHQYPQWAALFVNNEQYFIEKIGETYMILNKELGIIHGDIQVDHIFITKDGEVKLIDFQSFGSGYELSQFNDDPDKNDLMDVSIELTSWIDFCCSIADILKKTGIDIESRQNHLYPESLSDGFEGNVSAEFRPFLF